MNIKKTSILSVLMLGAAISASAQSEPAMDTAPVAIDHGPGLIGSNYTELGFGYENKNGLPGNLRDYDFTSNAAVYREGIWGADANFKYEFTDAGGGGFSDRRDEALFGLTGFMTQSWGKPFITADAGYAWQRAGGVSGRSFAYQLTGGVEFEVLRNLALAPFLEYDTEPRLHNSVPAVANFQDHVVEYGVRATYRLTRNWSLTAGASVDQYSGSDLGVRGGVAYRF
jgi:hypothetical protein